MSFRWRLYGIDPRSGEVWTYGDADGPPEDAPRLPVLCIGQPGAWAVGDARDRLQAGSYFLWHPDRACWTEHETAEDVIEQLVHEGRVRRGFYTYRTEYEAVARQMNDDIANCEDCPEGTQRSGKKRLVDG